MKSAAHRQVQFAFHGEEAVVNFLHIEAAAAEVGQEFVFGVETVLLFSD